MSFARKGTMAMAGTTAWANPTKQPASCLKRSPWTERSGMTKVERGFCNRIMHHK